MAEMLDKLRKPLLAVLDITIIAVSMSLAFMIRFDWNVSYILTDQFFFFITTAVIVRFALFAAFGMYQWSFRYASISEAMNILKAVTIGSLVLIAIAFFTEPMTINRSVLLIDYLLCLFLITSSRFLPRILIKFRQASKVGLTRVLIVGAGAAGEMVARQMVNIQDKVYQPVGFVDDDKHKINSRIHAVRVLGTTDDIKDIVKKFGVEEIIIAIPSANGKVVRDIVSKCEKTDTKIKIYPGINKVLNGEMTINHIRKVYPEDLLGREQVRIDSKDLTAFLQDRAVLVSGAAGTIGSELCRQIMKFSPRMLILYDHNENDMYFLQLELKEKFPAAEFKVVIGDIKDMELLKWVFFNYKPEIVFHSAAHKHVPLMEENPGAAVKNNIIGTRNLIHTSEEHGVKNFVMISTDKAVNPASIMGASKRIAEMMVQAKAKNTNTKFMAVRFGNVIGSSGSVIPIFKQQIEKGGPVTITHSEAKRFFMTASEATQLVLQSGAIGQGGEIFMLDMGEQIRIVDLARNLITLSGFTPEKDIEIKFTGLRPGEKIYEDMFIDAENEKTTKHDKIYITCPGDFDAAELYKNIKILEKLSMVMDNEKIIEKISEMVPTYKPNGND